MKNKTDNLKKCDGNEIGIDIFGVKITSRPNIISRDVYTFRPLKTQDEELQKLFAENIDLNFQNTMRLGLELAIKDIKRQIADKKEITK